MEKGFLDILSNGVNAEGQAWLATQVEAGDANAQLMQGLRLLKQNKSEGLRLLEASARSGNCIAAQYAAKMYLTGEAGVIKPDYKLAIRYFRLAAENAKRPSGNALFDEYLSLLGGQSLIAQEGLGVALLMDGQIAEGHKQLEEAVSKGSARAAYELGRRYLLGQDLAKNELQGCLLLLKAIANDNTILYAGPAANLLGGYYANDKHDYVRAFKMFEKATEKNHIESYVNIGQCYRHGYGCTPDPAKAFECFLKALQNHIKLAFYHIACCYFNGVGVPVDILKAIEYLEQGVQAGCYDCYGFLGLELCLGVNIAKDEERGMQLLEESAASGSHEGIENLEKYKLLTGKHFDIKKLATCNDCVARATVAYHMIYGNQTAKRPKEGYEMLFNVMSESDAKTNPVCLFFYGLCLMNGIPDVLEPDLDQAEIILKEVARLGLYDAYQYLGILYLNQDDEKKAVECFKTAHDHGVAGGSMNLGICYQNGCGVPKDLEQARHYFELCRLSCSKSDDIALAKRVEELVQNMSRDQPVLAPQPSSIPYDTECSICTVSFNDDDDLFACPCKHTFHRNCIMLYFRHFMMHRTDESLPLCPNCRAAIPLDSVRNCGVITTDFN